MCNIKRVFFFVDVMGWCAGGVRAQRFSATLDSKSESVEMGRFMRSTPSHGPMQNGPSR